MKYSYPLNYEPSLYGFRNWTWNFLSLFTFQKERGKTVLPYTKPYWLTPGLEPCSPHSQSGTLPVKLKPTFVIENRLELLSPVSETGMLPLHHSTICIAGRIRTCSLSVPGGVSNQLECCYVLKSIPAASHGEYFIPPHQLFFGIKKAGCFKQPALVYIHVTSCMHTVRLYGYINIFIITHGYACWLHCIMHTTCPQRIMFVYFSKSLLL